VSALSSMFESFLGRTVFAGRWSRQHTDVECRFSWMWSLRSALITTGPQRP